MKISSYPLSRFPLSGAGSVQQSTTDWVSEGGAVASSSARFLILTIWPGLGGAVSRGKNSAPCLKNWHSAGGALTGGATRIDTYREGHRFYESLLQEGFLGGSPRGSARAISNTGIFLTGAFDGNS